MAETFERALRVVAEGVPRPLAVFGADGVLKVANDRWAQLAATGTRPERGGISDHLAALGLVPVAGRPGVFGRGETEYQVVRTQAGNCTVVALEALTPTGHREAMHERFLSIASHDIRGPVANVRSYASLLASGKVELDARTRRAVDTIIRNADKALSLLRSFFDSVRADLSPPPVELEPQAITPLLEAEVERLRAPAGEKSLRFQVHFEPDLPEVPIDGERFSHIVYAYLLHGLNRTPNGGRLDVEVRKDEGALRVCVRDTGPALTAEQNERLYARDERVVAEGRLGGAFELCLAREEVLAHGGRVEHSTSAQGVTTFAFTLPL